MSFKECPNPSCRSHSIFFDRTMFDACPWRVACSGCRMEGPASDSQDVAKAYWDNLPRTQPMPEPAKDMLCMHCKGRVVVFSKGFGDEWRVLCEQCHASGPSKSSAEAAMEAYESMLPKPCEREHVTDALYRLLQDVNHALVGSRIQRKDGAS